MISLYCNCFIGKINKRVEYDQKNLMLGAIQYDPNIKSDLSKQKFFFDDTGDNISHLNKWFGQLTGLYWVWKNTHEQIIGTNTYRLFWGDYFLNNQFEKNTLYIPSTGDLGINIYDQYCNCHGELNLKLLYDLSDKNLIPIKTYMIENLKQQTLLYPFNIFICERETFNNICSVLFDGVLFTFFNQYKTNLIDYEKQYNQSRILDFLSERVLHMIYTNIDYFFPKLNIQTIPVVNLHHSS